MPLTDPINPSRKAQKTIATVDNPQHLEDNYIDLYNILVIVWKWKWLIIIVTVIAVLGSSIYALRLPRIYKANNLLLPPQRKEIQSLNVVGIKELAIYEDNEKIRTRINSGEVFKIFRQNLKSRSIQKKFVKEYGLADYFAPNRTPQTRDVDIYSGFSGLIKLEKIDGTHSLSIELNNPELAANWVNNFTNFVNRETVNMLVDNLKSSIENRKREIEYNIESKRFIARKRRTDQIIRYTENAKIAKELGIIDRVDATNIIQTTQMNVDMNNASSPLYYLGYEALMTEINVLRNRKSDDAFILGLRDLQEQLAMLNSIKLNNNKMSSVNIDQAASPPTDPVRPNSREIVAIATIISFFSAILFSLFADYMRSRNKEIN